MKWMCTCVGSPHQHTAHWWNMALPWWAHSLRCESGLHYPPPQLAPQHLHKTHENISIFQVMVNVILGDVELFLNSQNLSFSLTFGPLNSDLQRSYSCLACIYSKDLWDISTYIGSKTLSLAFDFRGINSIMNRHRERASYKNIQWKKWVTHRYMGK